MCLRCSPGLFRHSCGAVSCHTPSMAANPHLALTKNSSPTTLANGRRVAQNRGVQRQRLRSPVATGETPAGRSQRNPQSSPAPSADDAIPGQGPWSAPPPLWGGRRGPSTSTAPGTIHPRISANTYHIHGGGKPPPYGVEPISLWKLVCNFRPKTFKNRRRKFRRRFVVPNKITWRKPSSGCRNGAGRPP